MFLSLPSFVPEIVQAFPCVLAFCLLCAPFLKRHPLPCYVVAAAAVLLQDTLGAAAGTAGMGAQMGGSTATGGIVGAWAALYANPVGHAAVELLTSSYTGVSFYLIVMFVGVLQATPAVRRLRSVRSELSILGGIVVAGHVLRVFYLPFLFANPRFSAVWGAAFPYMFAATVVVGVPLTAVFLPLWVSSFPPVRRRMKTRSWRRLQSWAYLFMALMLLQGFLLGVAHAVYTGSALGVQALFASSQAGALVASFAGYVATAACYLVIGLFYLALWLQKRALARERRVRGEAAVTGERARKPKGAAV